MPATTPVAVVENGTLPGQRVAVTDLANLTGTIAAHDLRSPALLVVGDVARQAATLGWFGAAPLARSVRASA
jgi:uroporphyrin-III C-methyltransferase/precorrin-2 dehydrogenase/sirohydrochlorin ferrochelatase